MISYLSPTSIELYRRSPEEFYMRYVANMRVKSLPQTQPMSIGSAFDAYVKNWLTTRLFGETRPQFDLKTIFETQVEPHNRDWAWEHGRYVFNMYVESGALADLLVELEQAIEEPRFEFTVEGKVNHAAFVDGVPFLGKPDVYYKSKDCHTIFDWKVTGYCARRNVSPSKGYKICRDGWSGNHTRSHWMSHKDYVPTKIGGFEINCAYPLEEIDGTWAAQLAIYGWLLGEEVGADFVCCIDELCATGTIAPNGANLIRVASHRNKVSKKFQEEQFTLAHKIWTGLLNDTLFTPEEKQQYELRAAALQGDTIEDKVFRNMVR